MAGQHWRRACLASVVAVVQQRYMHVMYLRKGGRETLQVWVLGMAGQTALKVGESEVQCVE